MKKIIEKALVCALMLTVLICFSACGKVSAGTEIYFKIDESIIQTQGVNVSVSQTTTKRSFLGEDVYKERNYNSFGELDSINISVSGSILRQGLNDTSKDYFRLYVLAPYTTQAIYVKDDSLTHYDVADLEGDYFVLDVQWLNGFSHYGTVQDGKDINCFLIMFSLHNGKTIEYFVYVAYDLVF